MYKLAEIFETSTSISDYASRYFDHLHALLKGLDGKAIEAVVEAVETASRNGNTLFTMANGGSAAAASHLVNDLVAGSYLEGAPRLRALCLSDNVESVTALGNDAGFNHIFSHQLRVHMNPGDVVMAMSVSGNSENLIQAVDYANSNGGVTIGYCGFDGGRLAQHCQIAVHAVSTKDEYGPVEDMFNIMGHIVSGYIAMRRGKHLHH
ncbi:MAG: SIS domain-containing protein [Candidatus Hydrogenedentes bacterium]|nr:SIS domain-containing protein [Candidatus Hydrogenedentota bacterium]